MKTKKIIIEVASNANTQNSFSAFTSGQIKFTAASVGLEAFDKLKIDAEFGCVLLPNTQQINPFNLDSNSENENNQGFFSNDVKIDMSPQNSTFILRAQVAEKDLEATTANLMQDPNVKGVFSDVEIQPFLVCPGSAAVGTHLDVERLLCVDKLKARGMDGHGVTVAIVDTGINMNYLNGKGKTPGFNAAWSWRPSTSSVTLGSAPVSHGTMCAFDVAIVAPRCTLLDIALLSGSPTGPTPMSGTLSDAILAYSHLINFMQRPKLPGDNPSLVVNNSWGMFHPSWDYPVGHPGNFSSNPAHPFNRIVGTLAGLGADILFAAGNCGSECPDGRCQGVTNQGIYGANSHPMVTTVVGVATDLDRVGYSNRGPGKLTTNKPDITGYTHFAGSGVYAADGGTSAATPVVAGVVAAIRTVRPYNGTISRRPAAIRNILTTTANDLGAIGYDFTYGFGVVNGCKIAQKLIPQILDICIRYPKICRFLNDRQRFVDICKINPKICESLRRDIDKLPPNIDPEIIKLLKKIKITDPSKLKSLKSIEKDLVSLESNVENTDCNCK